MPSTVLRSVRGTVLSRMEALGHIGAIAVQDRSSKDFVLAFLYAPGSSGEEPQPIQGITRFEKLVFLALRAGGFLDLLNRFGYKPDNFGPFSDRLQDDLEALSDMGLVSRTRLEVGDRPADELVDQEREDYLSSPAPYVFGLTVIGRKIAGKIWESMESNEREVIAQIKMQFNKVPLDRLLSHVYLTSEPEWTSKSVVRDKYLQ